VSVRALVDRIAADPAVYDSIQRLAGRDAVARRIAPALENLSGRVLDVGGGTGHVRAQLPRDITYLCVDIEMSKLVALKRRAAAAAATRADGAALPFRSGTIDAVLLFAVLHHLPEDAMRAVSAEVGRVLAPRGRLIVLDAVWAPRRFIGRALWAADRGSHPRTAAAIEAFLARSFQIVNAATFTVLHQYVLFQCSKRADAGAAAAS
jgi:ubiquinone/menaquinone biosynthesis C-methylase UbiE